MQPNIPDPAALAAAHDDLVARVRAGTEKVAAMRRSLDRQEITGSTRGGEVTVRLLGTGRFVDVRIDPDAVRRYDAETVGALVLEAVNDGLWWLHAHSELAFQSIITETGG